jgi:hypothetical protein
MKKNEQPEKKQISILETFGGFLDIDKQNVLQAKARQHRPFEYDLILSLHYDFMQLMGEIETDPDLRHTLEGMFKAVCLSAHLAMLPDEARNKIFDRNKKENEQLGVEI